MTINDLKNEKRFVNFKVYEKNGETKKLPWDCLNDSPAKINNPSTWYDYKTAKDFVKLGKAQAVAIALNGDGLVCIDMDHAVENGAIKKDQLEIINYINSYTETSVSGKGIHIFLYGKKPGAKSRTSKSNVDIEIYDKSRFIILTENIIKSDIIEERQDQLKFIYHKYLEDQELTKDSIDFIIEQIRKSKFKEKFEALFDRGDLSLFNYDHSSCDASLMSIICRFTNSNFKAIEIFKRSKLNREKFEKRPDYQQRLTDLARKDKSVIKYKKEKAQITITDYDICSMLKSKFNDRILYNMNDNFYYYYNGKYHKKDASEILVKSLNALILDLENTGSYDNETIKAIKVRYLQARGAAAVKEYYKYLPGVIVSSDKFNAEKNLICCKNGIVDLKKNQLMPFNKDFMITKYIDIDYNEESYNNFETSMFLHYLKSVTEENGELCRYLQKLAGYFMTGETSDQSFYYIIGKASTGKSVFIELLRNITGTYCKGVQQNAFNINSNDFQLSLASISDARLVISSEENACNKMNTTLIKQLTGQDTVTARYLYSHPFDYIPKFKIIISTNEAPKMVSDVASMKRRLKAIPFNKVFKGNERNPNLINDLLKEKEMIFLWAIRGAKAFYEQGLEPPLICKIQVDKIFEDQDVFGLWVEQWCEKDPEEFCTTQSLWKSYENFCSHNGTGTGFKNMLCFSRYLNQRDYVERFTTGKMRGYKGLKIMRWI